MGHRYEAGGTGAGSRFGVQQGQVIWDRRLDWGIIRPPPAVHGRMEQSLGRSDALLREQVHHHPLRIVADYTWRAMRESG